jgi:alkaline phosphatase
MSRFKNVVGALAIPFLLSTSVVNAADIPKNVIVLIADGLGFNHVDASSLYEYGATGQVVYQSFPIRLGMSTYPANGHGYSAAEAWTDFDWVRTRVTDSAASATAMSTGVKTYNGAIGLDMDKQPIKNISELAEDLGKATGVVSSVEFVHATPAAFIAHSESRGNYSEIAHEMILDSRADVIMGPGHPLYGDDGQLLDSADYHFVGGPELWAVVEHGKAGLDDNAVEDANGDGSPDTWTFIQTREEFETLAAADSDVPSRVIGVPMVPQTLQYRRSGDRKALPPYVQPLNEHVPTLATMATAALNVLDEDPDGLFLMIEGGAVDWASHANASGRMIEEMVGFNGAVEAVVEWVETHGGWDETLVMVTGDHETGYMTGPGSGAIQENDSTVVATYTALVDSGKGNLPGFQWNSTSHVNTLIPFYAKGAGANEILRWADEWDSKRGYFINNTEYAQLVFSLWK